MKKYFQSNVMTVFYLFVGAMLVSVVMYPEIFITYKTSFVLWWDHSNEYQLTFILAQFFHQGGIQLWNFFGQQPFFHTYVAYGFFKLPSVVTVAIYSLLESFSGDSGRLFHHAFAWGNLMTLLLIRVVGIFLLLKTVTKNRTILGLGTIIFSVFFCQQAFCAGVLFTSYFPLGMYFIVRFFQEFRLRYLAAFLLFMSICFGNCILQGAYVYLPLHFFIMAGIVWKIIFNPAPIRDLGLHRWQKGEWMKALGVCFVAALIFAPYVWMVADGLNDIAFGKATSRISHMFSPQWYFNSHDLDSALYFKDFLNMHMSVTLPGVSLYYIGWSFLFLVMTGFVLGKNNLKWFFALGVFFLWLLGHPRDHMNIGLIAHWANALTNPLKTLVRSYQYACQPMIPFLLMPLAAMGIEEMVDIYRGKECSGFALGVLSVLIIFLAAFNVADIPMDARVYLIGASILSLGGIAWIFLRNSLRAKRFLVGLVCLLAVIDLIFIVYQSKTAIASYAYSKPVVFDASPSSGMVGFDFENPSIFLYRNTYAFNFSYADEPILWVLHNVSSSMRHVVNQALNFSYLNAYNPRHVAFENWVNDGQMLAYLKQNKKFIFLAQSAINESTDALSKITEAGLTRQVVMVNNDGGTLKLPDHWPSSVSSVEEDVHYNQLSGAFDSFTNQSEYSLQGDLSVFTLNLPADFPTYLATSWFSEEQAYLRFFIEIEAGKWRELQQTQGELIRPNTFEVQNIKKGVLHAAFPQNDYPVHRKYVLLYPSHDNEGVLGVWRGEFDNFGFTFKAKKNGWLVCHYPYDPKFRIAVDGKKVPYYRVNKSFIGFPLSQGEHKILIQYWPHSFLRLTLLISALLIVLGLPVLMFWALKKD